MDLKLKLECGWRDELYYDFFKLKPFEPRGREKQKPDRGMVAPLDVVKAWKMLHSQDWFIDAFHCRDVEKGHGIAEEKWGMTMDLIVWWSLKIGKNSVTSDNKLSTDAAQVLNALSVPCAIDQLEGVSLKDIFEQPDLPSKFAGILAKFKVYKIVEFEND